MAGQLCPATTAAGQGYGKKFVAAPKREQTASRCDATLDDAAEDRERSRIHVHRNCWLFRSVQCTTSLCNRIIQLAYDGDKLADLQNGKREFSTCRTDVWG